MLESADPAKIGVEVKTAHTCLADLPLAALLLDEWLSADSSWFENIKHVRGRRPTIIQSANSDSIIDLENWPVSTGLYAPVDLQLRRNNSPLPNSVMN